MFKQALYPPSEEQTPRTPKGKSVQRIVADFLFEPIEDLRVVLERRFPGDIIDINDEVDDRTISVSDGDHTIVCRINTSITEN